MSSAVNPLARLPSAPSWAWAHSLRKRDTGMRDTGRARRESWRPWLTALISVTAPLAAMLVSRTLEPLLQAATPLPFAVAILVAAWLGGPLAGLFATGLSVAIEAVALMPPYGVPTVDPLAARLHLVMLATTGLLVAAIAGLRARAEASAVVAMRQAEEVLERADTAARRLEALQRLATDLAEAETVDDILAALLARASVALRSDRCAVAVLDPAADGGAREVLALSRATAPGDASLPAELAAVGDDVAQVAQNGVPRFHEGRANRGTPAGQAVAAVPIRLPCGPGALTFWWDSAHPLPMERQAFVASLARAGSAALDRHRMFAAEVDALRRAEAATGYLNILADAGATLGTPAGYEDLVQRLGRLGVPRLGDLAVLDLEEKDGVRRVVTVDDATLDGVRSTIERHPLSVGEMEQGEEALRAGRAATYRLDDSVVAGLDRRPALAAALRQLSPAWLLLLPIPIAGATKGVLTFVRRGDRQFEPGEVAVGEELGRRAGRALESARLVQQVADLAEMDRRRAAEFEAVLGAVEEGFLLADADGVIRSSNSAAARVLGGPVTTLDELLDRLVDSAGHTPRALPAQPEELLLRSRPNVWVELASYRAEPSSPLAASSVVIACRDVTAFRRGQALREAFMGLLSHELRTPVTTIYAAAAVLMRRGRELDPAVADELLADVAGEADRLYRLVEDLMVLARFDEGIELGAQPVLLQHLIPAAVRQEATRWPAVSFDCDVESDLETVGGDETAIAQVLRNLLSNAAKYSPVGGRIDVRIRREADGVAVAVRDGGPGIAQDEAERIFDPFYRSPSTASLASGAGIGLYVSRRLVDAMGGRISAGSAEGGGSEFTFVLPRYEEAA